MTDYVNGWGRAELRAVVNVVYKQSGIEKFGEIMFYHVPLNGTRGIFHARLLEQGFDSHLSEDVPVSVVYDTSADPSFTMSDAELRFFQEIVKHFGDRK